MTASSLDRGGAGETPGPAPEPRDEDREVEAAAAAPSSAERPSHTQAVSPALVLLLPLATFSLCTMVLARALVPALRGWKVGLSRVIDVLDVVAATLSQLLALALILGVGAQLLLLLRSRAHAALRMVGVFAGVMAAFAALTTIGIPRLPAVVHGVVAGCACVVALVFGADATRRAGAVGLVPVSVGLAAALRGAGAFLAERAQVESRDTESVAAAFHMAQVLSTLALGLVVVAIVVALVSSAGLDRRRARVGVPVVLLFAALVSWKVTASVNDLEPAWGVLLRRFGQQLLTRPSPLVDPVVPVFVAAAVPAAAALVLLLSRRAPRVGAALCLILLTGASAEVPLLGLGLLLGALGLALDRRDPHGVLAALERSEADRR